MARPSGSLSQPPPTGPVDFLGLSQMAIGAQWVKHNKPEGTQSHGEGTQFKEDSKYSLLLSSVVVRMWLSPADFGFLRSWKFRFYEKSVSGV